MVKQSRGIEDLKATMEAVSLMDDSENSCGWRGASPAYAGQNQDQV